MARLFNGANVERLKTSTAAISAQPFSFSCWFYSTDMTKDQGLMMVVDPAQPDEQFLLSAMGTQSNILRFRVRASGSALNADTANTISQDTWQHAAGVAADADNRKAYLNGDLGNLGLETTTAVPTGLDTTVIGYQEDSTPSWPMYGRIADAAVWNVGLTFSEVLRLSKGYSPLLVRPESLVNYWPLIGGNLTTEPDYVGDIPLVETSTSGWGTRNAQHPPLFYPIYPRSIVPPLAVAAPGLLTQSRILITRDLTGV